MISERRRRVKSVHAPESKRAGPRARKTRMRARRRQRWCSLWLVVLTACAGNGHSQRAAAKSSATQAPDPVAFVCHDQEPPPLQPLRRLSHEQYRHTVTDLVNFALPAQLAQPVQLALAPAFELLPQDVVTKDAPFSSMDQSVSQQHVEAYAQIAARIAELLTRDQAHVSALLGCAPKKPARECIDRFVRRFGRRAFRRPMADPEFRFYRAGYTRDAIDAALLRSLLSTLLAAPEFVYQVEHVSEPVPGKAGTSQLDPYSLAARLSYHFWQTMPDEELLRAAERGELATEQGIARVVERMLADPRAERSLRAFVAEWFDLKGLRALDSLVGDPVFDAFAGEDLPSPDLREAMAQDVLDSFVYHVRQGGTYADWLTSPFSFARSDELAKLYAAPVWDGKGQPPRFPAGTRVGLLTRAALLATGTANTRPIMKGVFIRKRLLCDTIPPPPPNAANVPPPLSPSLTTREVVTALTEQPGSACASCHSYQINPLGFATENYDALGRRRTEQRLFSPTGQEVGRKPVNTLSVPRVHRFDATETQGPAELVEKILHSGKGEGCFARQYVRFSFGRFEDLERDGCTLEDIRLALERPAGLREALRALALRPAFRQRTLAGP